MTVPDLFPVLPDDVLRFIYEIAHLNIDELLALRSVCKRFKDAIDKYLGGRQGEIKRVIQRHSLNLQDPLYSDFIQQIEGVAPFNEEIFKNIRQEHIDRHLMLKNLTPEKLDRTFGYMLQNREFFKQIFPNSMRNDLNPEELIKIHKYRKHFVEFVKENFSTDEKYIQFHALAVTDQSLGNETGPLTLSQFRKNASFRMEVPSSRLFSKVSLLLLSLIFMSESGLGRDLDLIDRCNQAYTMIIVASLIDLHIFVNSFLWFFENFAPDLSEYYDIPLVSCYIALFVQFFISPSWTVFRHIDRAIYLSPSARNFVIDSRHVAFDTLFLIIVIVTELLISIIDAWRTILPDIITQTLRTDVQRIHTDYSQRRNQLAQEAQQRQLRRQAALENVEVQ